MATLSSFTHALPPAGDRARGGAEPGLATIAGLFAVFVLAWFLYGVFAHEGTVLNDDVTEAYVWGREFQLGYHQHPPFWAWIAGLWFMVWPSRPWAFDLLSVLNSAVGLLGIWYLVGRFAAGEDRKAAWLLVLLIPYYTFRCYKYNADTIFLSIWPWMALCFLRALDTRSVRDAVFLGVIVGVAFLSKYYALVLLLTCLAASVLHPGARAYWRSASPRISAAISFVMLLPHLVWLVRNHAPPIQYALSLDHYGLLATLRRSAALIPDMLSLLLGVIVLVVLTRRRSVPAERGPDFGILLVLTVLPPLLTLGFGIVLGMELRSAMVIGVFPLVPLLLLRIVPGADSRRLVWWTGRIVAVGTVLVVAASPLIARTLYRPSDPSWSLPLREAARAGARLWHQATGRRLAYVGGSWYYSNAAAFYIADHPAGFVDLDFSRSAWVTPEALRRDGLLAICVHTDATCRRAAVALGGWRAQLTAMTLTRTEFGKPRGTAAIDFYVIPPQS